MLKSAGEAERSSKASLPDRGGPEPKPGDTLRFLEIDEWFGGYHITGTVTQIYDPEVGRRAREFMADCILMKLPAIMQRARTAETECCEHRRPGRCGE